VLVTHARRACGAGSQKDFLQVMEKQCPFLRSITDFSGSRAFFVVLLKSFKNGFPLASRGRLSRLFIAVETYPSGKFNLDLTYP